VDVEISFVGCRLEQIADQRQQHRDPEALQKTGARDVKRGHDYPVPTSPEKGSRDGGNATEEKNAEKQTGNDCACAEENACEGGEKSYGFHWESRWLSNIEVSAVTMQMTIIWGFE
jgi:hypothetical protein